MIMAVKRGTKLYCLSLILNGGRLLCGLALYLHANTNDVVLFWKWDGCLKCRDVLVVFFFFFFGEGYFVEIDVPYQSIQCTLNYNNFVTLPFFKKKKLSRFCFF